MTPTETPMIRPTTIPPKNSMASFLSMRGRHPRHQQVVAARRDKVGDKAALLAFAFFEKLVRLRHGLPHAAATAGELLVDRMTGAHLHLRRSGSLIEREIMGQPHCQHPDESCCNRSGEPWPCAIAKVHLTVEFDRFPSVLAIYMAAQMHDALLDLTVHGTSPPSDLYERFLAWIIR